MVIRRSCGHIVFYQFEALAQHGVNHGVFTRLGGVSPAPYASLNVGHTVGDDHQRVDANQLAIYGALGIRAEQVVTAHQVHGHRVSQARPGQGGQVIPATDGLISHVAGQALLMRFADCMSVFLYDPDSGAIGLAHAGWRGTMENVAGEAVRAMERAFGVEPRRLLAGLGPAIGACCYQVGEEVVAAACATFDEPHVFLQEQADGSYHFDLAHANAWQLSQAGVGHIEVAPLCTACHVDEFFSHRAERGQTGRFAALLVHGDAVQDAQGGDHGT